jgi:plasmid stabilization system protein ParE
MKMCCFVRCRTFRIARFSVARDDLRPGVRTFPVGQHLIVYEVDDLAIRVARLLHQRMDVHRALHDE